MLLRSGQLINKPPGYDLPLNTKETIMGERTLEELSTPNLVNQPLSIAFPALDMPLKLNSGFLNLLPKFHGLLGEDHTDILPNF